KYICSGLFHSTQRDKGSKGQRPDPLFFFDPLSLWVETMMPDPQNQGVVNDRIASLNCCSLAGSLRPGSLSTPLLTSTAYGLTVVIASAMFSGESPPARKTLASFAACRAISQFIVLPVPPYTILSNESSRIARDGNLLMILTSKSSPMRMALITRSAPTRRQYSSSSSPCNCTIWTRL